jgi:MSHA biogenesis protein MshP
MFLEKRVPFDKKKYLENETFLEKKQPLEKSHTFTKQQGFLLPVALFIIVVIGGMALMVSKKVSESTATYIISAVSTQAFYAAESGAQAGMYDLFFIDTDRQLVDGRCAAMAISQVLSVQGVTNCTIAVSCRCHYENGNSCDETNSANYLGSSGSNNSFYTLNAQSSCGSDPATSQHLIEVGASL